MNSLRTAMLIAIYCFSLCYTADLTKGAIINTELHPEKDHPREHLFDGDITTFYAHMRFSQSYWRIHFKEPANVHEIALYQGWTNWAQAKSVTITNSMGEDTTLILESGHGIKQLFSLNFRYPTDYIKVYVDSTQTGLSTGEWGGFAEMEIEGEFVSQASETPEITHYEFSKITNESAIVRWTTNIPTAAVLSFSTDSLSKIKIQDTLFTTSHEKKINGFGEIRGLIKIEATSQTGRSIAEWYPMKEDGVEKLLDFGIGDGWFNVDNEWIPAWEMYERDSVEVDVIQSWVGTPNWQSFTDSKWIREHVDRGYTIQFLHFYFGDWPTIEKVTNEKEELLADLEELADTIAASGCDSAVMITLEPEYNQADVAGWEGWNDIMLEAMEVIRAKAPNVSIGLIAGDWDFEHLIPISMGRAARKADYVAFQEMRASTKNTSDEALATVSKALRFAKYMRDHFYLPIRWDYLLVSDYNGWEEVQCSVVTELFERIEELQKSSIVGVNWMAYMDDPRQSDGYYGKAEAHKGLKSANNEKKRVWSIWSNGCKSYKDKKQTVIQHKGANSQPNIEYSNHTLLIEDDDYNYVALYNLLGKRVFFQTSNEISSTKNRDFNLPSSLTQGCYIVYLQYSNKKIVMPIMIK